MKNVWGDVQHAFDEAVHAKDSAFRALQSNPLEHVRGPHAGRDRQGQILYSEEVGKSGQLFRMPPPEDKAELLRRDLK